jgi:hypothetical protein
MFLLRHPSSKKSLYALKQHKTLKYEIFLEKLFSFLDPGPQHWFKLCKSYKESMKLTAKSTKLKVMSNPYHRSKISFAISFF